MSKVTLKPSVEPGIRGPRHAAHFFKVPILVLPFLDQKNPKFRTTLALGPTPYTVLDLHGAHFENPHSLTHWPADPVCHHPDSPFQLWAEIVSDRAFPVAAARLWNSLPSRFLTLLSLQCPQPAQWLVILDTVIAFTFNIIKVYELELPSRGPVTECLRSWNERSIVNTSESITDHLVVVTACHQVVEIIMMSYPA